MPGEEYNYIPGDLARQDLYPDERGFQPPPPPITPITQMTNRIPAPQDVWEKYDNDRKYGTPDQWAAIGGGLATPEQSHQTADALKDLVVPQTPLDYALLATPWLKGAGMAAKGAIYGASAAMSPSDAQAGPASKLTKAGEWLTGFAPGAADEVTNRVVKYGKDEPYLKVDPHHGFTDLRTGKTPDEMMGSIVGMPSLQRPLVRPEDLLGSELIFTPGDRGAGGGTLKSVGGVKLDSPVKLEGGADYPFLHEGAPLPGMSDDAMRLWANAPAQTTGMLNLGNDILKRGNNPVLMYQAMGKQSIDSAKQMALPAVDLARQGSVTNKGGAFINDWMERQGVDDFPGWRSSKLEDWINNTTGTNRSKLVKGMDLREARDEGFPDLGELRYVQTNPKLLNTPTGSAGLTVSQFDPTLGAVANSLHTTYPTAVAGSEAGTLGGSIPWHIAAPDLHANLMAAGDPVRFAERPDYYSVRMPTGLPKTQVVDNKWVDTVSEWMRKNPQLWSIPGGGVMGGLAAMSPSDAQAGPASKLLEGAGSKLGELAEPFYSAVERAVQGAKQNVAPGSQWAGFLRNAPGVKPEEVDALGLSKLFEQPGSVSKDAVLGEIAANKVNVGEVVKGGGVTQKFGTPEEQAAATQRFETARQAVNDFPRLEIGSPEWRAAGAELGAAEAAMRDVVPGWGRAPGGGEFQVGGDTKFGTYTLPGGENYREMLLTLPTPNDNYIAAVDKLKAKYGDKPLGQMPMTDAERAYIDNQINAYGDTGGTFKSSHFDEPNILAHVRYNDRTIDGKKTLFVEEVQSDWHQKGKREGYQTDQPQFWVRNTRSGNASPFFDTLAEADAYRNNLPEGMRESTVISQRPRTTGTVPDAPFKTTWPDLAMKRVIREAAEKGYDKVAWTPGSVQADRYDLSKHVDEIHYDPKSELLAHKNKGTDTWNENDVPKDRLANYIGKDAAEKLLNSEPNKYPNGDDYYSLKGIDLKVGGEGMKGFYDQILPATVNKLVKKHGGKVETSQLKGATEATTENLVKSGRDVVIDHGDVRDPSETIKVRDRDTDKVLFETKDYDAAKKFAAEYRLPPVPVHSIDITPSLRAAAMKGFPLFSAGGVAATGMMGDLAKQDDYR